MQLSALDLPDFERALAGDGVCMSLGPFTVRLRNSAPGLAQVLAVLYAQSTVSLKPLTQFADFDARMVRPRFARRYFRPQVRIESDSDMPFEPFPLSHAYPHFEWGLNWLIATQAHQYLMFHSAVLERNGRALVLPAAPGSGKSTLCSALMLRGWRLLSDEFGLYRPETGLLEAVPRPIPLKNESIDVIREFSEEAVLGPTYPETRKGDVAHLRPSATSVENSDKPAKPGWIVFPQYKAGTPELLHPFAKGRAFLRLSGNSFNYRLQGARGFQGVADVIDNSQTWHLEFSDLNAAVKLLEEMAQD